MSDFGQAIKWLKEGNKVRRAGWKVMYLYLVQAKAESETHYIPKKRTAAFIVISLGQKTHQPGWLASQADMLAEDWELYHD